MGKVNISCFKIGLGSISGTKTRLLKGDRIQLICRGKWARKIVPLVCAVNLPNGAVPMPRTWTCKPSDWRSQTQKHPSHTHTHKHNEHKSSDLDGV